MSGDLRRVTNAMALSRATMKNIRQNLVWKFAYNTALIPVAAGLLYPAFGILLSPVFAVLAMAASSVSVLGNALRLKRFSPPVAAPRGRSPCPRRLKRSVFMNIGEAAHASGVSAKMIRYYESIGLVGAARRSGNGYRVYSESDIHTLAFIRRARNLGFSITHIEQLMMLWRDKGRASAEVKAIALRYMEEMQAKIEELQSIRRTLEYLASHCDGDERPAARSSTT